jgi:hypothetical protein
LATSAWAAATSADPDEADDEALAETELLEAVELLELLLDEQAASSAVAVRAAAGAARRFHVRVMLKIPPSTDHGGRDRRLYFFSVAS